MRKEGITDGALRDAVARAERGLIDADLGSGVIKQRVPRPGQGRSGGFRTLLAFKAAERSAFLFGFAKSDQDNVDAGELKVLRKAAAEMLGWSEKQVAAMLANGRRSMMSQKYKSKIAGAVHEAMQDAFESGVIDKRTMRDFDERCLTKAKPLSAREIQKLREHEGVSQSVFARHLNVAVKLVGEWERGQKKPSGPSLKLLALVKAKGLDAIA